MGEGDVDVGFFARADHLPGRVQGLALKVRVQREVVETAVCESVAVICWNLATRQQLLFSFARVTWVGRGDSGKRSHLACCTRAIRFALARVEIDRCAPLPERRFEIWLISGVGTISWFLLPISTCVRLVSFWFL